VAADMAALLDFLHIPKAVIIGHDWGSALAWRFALWHPERCKAVVNLSIPYSPPPRKYISIEEAAKRLPMFGYQVYFASPESTSEIEQNLDKFFATMYQTPTSSHKHRSITRIGELQEYLLSRKGDSPNWDTNWNSDFKPSEIEYYIKTFRQGGMNGPLNWYRTTKLRYEEEQEAQLPANLPSHLPWLLVYGSKDPTCSPKHCESTKLFVPQIEVLELEGVSHWVMTEAKQSIIDAIIQFVQSRVEMAQSKLMLMSSSELYARN